MRIGISPSIHSLLQVYADADRGAATWRGINNRLTAQHPCTFTDAEQTEASSSVASADGKALAIVADDNFDETVAPLHNDARFRCVSVLDDVGHSLLHDAIEVDLLLFV